MARTTYITIPEGQEDLYWQPLQSGDRFTFSKITRKSAFFGREKIAGLTRRSYLPTISTIWKTYTDDLKNSWKLAGEEKGINGWQAFVADQAQRIKYGIEGEAIPSVYHQDWVGAIIIEEPAEEIKLVQYHPTQYWISRKVQGKKRMYEPVSVTEKLYLPLTLSINFTSNLVSTGDNSFCKFYAKIRNLYQGQNLSTNLDVNIPLSSGWSSLSEQISNVTGEAVSYDLYIHLYNVRGTLLFDNPEATHSAQNWVRDPFCKDISKTFTRAFYQVPQSWAAIILPEGAAYNSAYPE
jgi:hypothetical protein